MQPSMMIVRSRIGWLGEAKEPVRLRLLVKDFKDRGFTGVEWTIARNGVGELPITGKTNGNGTSVVTFDTSAPRFVVTVHLPEGDVMKPMSVEDAKGEVVTVRSVEVAPQPFLTTMEIVAGTSGLALIALGFFSNTGLVQRVGETVLMATAFYRVGRAVM